VTDAGPVDASGNSDATIADAAISDGQTQDALVSGGDSAPGPYACIPDSGSTCNTVPNDGPFVQPVYASGSLPAFTGGAITPGLYYLVSEEIYGADAGAADSGSSGTEQAFVVSLLDGGSYLFEIVRYNTNDGCSRGSLVLTTTSSSTITASQGCGDLLSGGGGNYSGDGGYGDGGGYGYGDGGGYADGGGYGDGGASNQSLEYSATSTTFSIPSSQGDGSTVLQTFVLQSQ
jgi:hypothetical protein